VFEMAEEEGVVRYSRSYFIRAVRSCLAASLARANQAQFMAVAKAKHRQAAQQGLRTNEPSVVVVDDTERMLGETVEESGDSPLREDVGSAESQDSCMNNTQDTATNSEASGLGTMSLGS
jgi:Tfp pilus assembly protein PilW